MKILYHHRVTSPDGQAVHIRSLIEALRGEGHEVVVVGPVDLEKTDLSAGSGASGIVRAVLPRSVCELLELAYSMVAFIRLWAAFQRHRPAVLYERYNLFTLAGLGLKRLCGIPLIVEVNAPLCEERSRHGGLSLERLARWSERVVWQGADWALPVTGALAGHLRAAGVPEERICIIPNAVGAEFLERPDEDDLRRRLGVTDRTVLGFTGFIRDWHGLDQVLDVMAGSDRQDLHLLVVGDGPARASLERQARTLGLEARVTFAGVVPRAQIATYVRCFDIALQPRVLPYASPLKLQEYMAAGAAIVAPRAANLLEVLDHERTAQLFEPDDPDGLRNAIHRLARDPDLRKRLGAAARRSVLDHGLTWERNAQRIIDLIRKVPAPQTIPAPEGRG